MSEPQTTCVRCGRTEPRSFLALAIELEFRSNTAASDADKQAAFADIGWSGTADAAVCPGCQFAEWHPHCMSIVDIDGERVDFAKVPAHEIDAGSVFRCEYIDLDVSWIEDDDYPESWTCPKCGGTEFEGVHRDYQPSGLEGASFTVEIEEGESEGA